jgi:hypothetical protein
LPSHNLGLILQEITLLPADHLGSKRHCACCI